MSLLVLTAAAAALTTQVTVATAPRAALSVSPAHVAFDAGGRAALHVETGSGRRLRLRASVAGLALDRRGKPRVVARRDAAPWLSVSPVTVDVGPAGATLVIGSRRQPSSQAGEHSAVVLLTATAPAAKGVAIELRVGVVVTVRVKGRLVHRVEVTAARLRRQPLRRYRLIELTFANRGNVIESIGGPRLRIGLLRRGRVIARFQVMRRKVLPHTAAVVVVAYRGHRHGPATVRVELPRPGGRITVRSFPLRL